ncbi:MAG: response regulator [Nitrospinae bacterium]|nr:response regulator [Nitrospinota bacterium]
MNTAKYRILCVDDESRNLALLEAILMPMGYEAVAARNGKQALEIIRRDKIDIVLLDVMMPLMNGFDVCKEIKGSEQYRGIPVILVTALTSTEDRIKGIEAGSDDFISKPYDKGEILARIKMLLKAKELNDRLSSAYKNIISLTSFGENIIKTFNPLDFNLISKIDSVVSQIIGRKGDAPDKPQTVIVNILNEKGGHDWYYYQFISNNLTSDRFNPNISFDLSKEEYSRVSFYNNLEGEIRFKSFVEKLKAFNIMAKNMVCYLSYNISIFALNYGRDINEHDAAVLDSLVMHTLFLRSLSLQIKEVEDALTYTVYALARAAEANDDDTGNHILRVGIYCAVIAERLKMPKNFVDTIRLQASLHDVGKIHVHPNILKKPGKFTDEEFAIMKMHTTWGAKIIGDHPRFAIGASIALNHHERWDGGGYPNRLKGGQIPVEARIMNIADQYDALRNARVYKPAYNHETTYKIITEGDGRTMPHHFDPQALQAFKETASKFEEVYEKLKG